ncbi:hypothetical protein 7AX1_166 [uncultured Caudovirales phage]|uniref:Uncharacterized protein n=1 Tax=uncultured Caudovirales phage TaxID=2100421 RepID=A0A2H4J655_9CAUD|nr:hypothetical protein 7AX1_166 [uncultured Caudovirales phage]
MKLTIRELQDKTNFLKYSKLSKNTKEDMVNYLADEEELKKIIKETVGDTIKKGNKKSVIDDICVEINEYIESTLSLYLDTEPLHLTLDEWSDHDTVDLEVE